MSITVAKSAGFCFGVNRAVEMVEQAAGEEQQVFTLGPIIHNRHAVAHFEAMGVQVMEDASEAKPGQTVIIRSHGVTKAVYQQLIDSGAKVVDATCPFVKRIHGIVEKAEQAGKTPIIIGTPDHPEVVGIAGWCEHGKVFSNREELENWVKLEKNPPGFANLYGLPNHVHGIFVENVRRFRKKTVY